MTTSSLQDWSKLPKRKGLCVRAMVPHKLRTARTDRRYTSSASCDIELKAVVQDVALVVSLPYCNLSLLITYCRPLLRVGIFMTAVHKIRWLCHLAKNAAVLLMTPKSVRLSS
jgi:hypothetical protein